MKESKFYIAKMDCPTEEQLIRNRFKSMDGIEGLEFNLMQRVLTVTHQADEKEILAALANLGLEPRLRAEADPQAARPAAEVGEAVRGSKWAVIAVSGLAAAAAELYAWTSGKENSLPVVGLALFSMAVGGRETLRRGLLAVRTRTININLLMTIAIVGAIAIQQWPEAAMVTFLFALAETIETYSLDRARNAIRGLLELSPDVATVRGEEGEWREVEASSVRIGQVIRIRPGERIPLDGAVTAGRSTVNQAPITGESIPVTKTQGDAVFAGTVNEHGSLEVKVTADKGNTTIDRIIKTVQEAQSQRAPTQRFVDKFARYYTPAMVALAVLIAIVPPLLFGQAFGGWIYKALVLLVIACPCALVISTPVTVVSGLAAAARNGILVKGGIYLEEGKGLRAVALDKTGTLTHGKPVVTDVIPLNEQPREELLHLTASLDAHSEHPVAAAIVSHCSVAHGPDVCRPYEVANFQAIAGRGVRGEIAGQLYFVGNHRLAEENGVCSTRVESELHRLEEEGKTTVVLSTKDTALAVLGVADTLRETSAQAVQSLHNLRVRTIMLTGDNETTARAIAESVGIDDIRGNLLPEEKLAAIDELLATHGVVGMVGDGINDAPALAKATIGFAMGAAGTGTALETADIALMEDDLRKLPEFVKLSRRTARILVQNICLAIGIKVVFFALALAGRATLWMAVFADMGASLLVVFNGLRLLRPGEGQRE